MALDRRLLIITQVILLIIIFKRTLKLINVLRHNIKGYIL
jgi:hypothetical protein